jgi:type I restriction enzyme S subunit
MTQWQTLKLGGIVSIKTGKIDANKAIENGKYPFFTCAREIYRIDDAPYEGKVVLVAGNGDLNVKYYEGKFNAYQRTYFLTSLDENRALPKYIYFFMEHYLQILRTQSIGTTVKYIKMENLSEAMIPLPSIDEQHKIVELLEDHLSRLDAALVDVRQAKIKAAQFRRSILQAAFSGYLTSRETVSGTSLPEDWAHWSIGDMCRSVSKIDPINLGRDSFKYVDIGSLEPSSSSLENIEAIQTTDAPGRARQLLAVGDSIFATVRPYMKKVAYISQEFDGEIASTGFCVLRPIEEQLHAKYLFYFLLSDDLLDQVLPLQRGVSYPAIRDNDLRNAFIPLPPISEQQRIVAILEDYFSRMEATTKIADDMEKQAAALRRSLLQAAFTGQLTKEVISV